MQLIRRVATAASYSGAANSFRGRTNEGMACIKLSAEQIGRLEQSSWNKSYLEASTAEQQSPMAIAQLKLRLGALLLVLLTAMAVMAYTAATRLEATAASIDTVFKDRVVCLQQLHVIGEAFGQRIPDALRQVRQGQTSNNGAAELITHARSDAELQWQAYKQTYLTVEETRLASEAQEALARADAAASQIEIALKQRAPSQDEEAVFDASARKLLARLDALVALQVDVARQEDVQARLAYRKTVWAIVGLACVSACMAALLTWAVLGRYSRETTEHQARLARLNAFYSALSKTNRLIVREPDEATLLAEICSICVGDEHAHMSCVHLLDGDTVHRVATAGRSLDFYKGLATSWRLSDEDTKGTVASKVLRSGKSSVLQDYEFEVSSNRWAKRAREYGIRAVGTFPIFRGGQVFGALSLYANVPHFFDKPLIDLAEEIVGDLSFALDNIDRKAKLTAAAAAAESQREAEASNRAKTQFLSTISHELRTPLNAMLGFAQLIQRDARDRLAPTDIAQLDRIRQAGWHLLSLVNDVMDVSSIEAGRFDVQVRALPLLPMLDEAVRLSEQVAHQSGIAIGSAFRNMEPVEVLADPVRLRQVLINLLSNATKYNRPAGSVYVTATAQEDVATIEVKDTGLGMSSEQLEHVCEPFNRLGRERGGIAGTGLGLALTQQLVTLMGGTLAFESKIGVGTSARVTLRRASAQDSRQSVAGAEFGVHVDKSLEGSVLYIEDNEINVLIVEQMIAEWPRVQFMHAPDGEVGIEMAKARQPSVILLDMHLPGTTGLEVLKILKSESATLHLEVVVLSASALEGDIEQALDAGARDYWTKPLDFERFLVGVGDLLRKAPIARSVH